MRRGVGIAAVWLGLGLSTGPARGEVYTWVDRAGTVHYSAEPPPPDQRSGQVRTIEVDPSPPEPAARPAATPPAEASRAASAAPKAPAPAKVQPKPRRTPSVVLYTTSWCPWCKKAKAFFSSRGIPFTERDIEAEPGAMERKLGLDGDRRVPTAVIGETVVRGYAPSEYQAALEQPQ
jgi:glutaredoxin